MSLQRQSVGKSFALGTVIFIHQLGLEEIDVNEVISKVPFSSSVLLFFMWFCLVKIFFFSKSEN